MKKVVGIVTIMGLMACGSPTEPETVIQDQYDSVQAEVDELNGEEVIRIQNGTDTVYLNEQMINEIFSDEQ